MYMWTWHTKTQTDLWMQTELPVQVGVLKTHRVAGDSSSVIAKPGALCRTELASPGGGPTRPCQPLDLPFAPRCPADMCQLSNLRTDSGACAEVTAGPMRLDGCPEKTH